MDIVVFDSGDQPFLDWITDNQDGYVLNVMRNAGSAFGVLHRSGCGHLTGLVTGQAEDAYTTQNVIKVCSLDAEVLTGWLSRERPAAVEKLRLCKDCQPGHRREVQFQGQTVSRGRVLSVMREFGRQFPDTNLYDHWLEDGRYTYALAYQGRLYPCKYIASLAAGIPNSGYSGGDQTNAVFTGLGFRVISKPTGNINTVVANDPVLGKLYSRRQIHRIVGGNIQSYLPTVDGKVVCGCFDPAMNPRAPIEISVGKAPATVKAAQSLTDTQGVIPVFLKQASKQWEYVGRFRAMGMSTDPEDLAINRIDAVAVLYLEPVADSDTTTEVEAMLYPNEAVEGKLRMVSHLRRERNGQISKSKKRDFKQRHGELLCEVCGVRASAFPNDVGEACFEVHHTVPISELADERITRLDDLAVLCANCHRMIHRTSPLMAVEVFRGWLGG